MTTPEGRTLDPVTGQPVRFVDDPRTWKREYMREYRAGRRRIPPFELRVLAMLDREHGPVINEDLGRCWVWMGSTNNAGYGIASDRGRNHLVHRVVLAWALRRPLHAGMWACHKCDNPVCARPLHLYEGTPSENNDDSWRRTRRARRAAEEAIDDA